MEDFDSPYSKKIETQTKKESCFNCDGNNYPGKVIEIDKEGYCPQCGESILLPNLNKNKIKFIVDEIHPILLEIIMSIVKEVAEASIKYPPFHSMHEGYAVILEELDELKEAIWKSKGVRLNPVAAKEAIQVAAMAVRFILDLEGEKE